MDSAEGRGFSWRVVVSENQTEESVYDVPCQYPAEVGRALVEYIKGCIELGRDQSVSVLQYQRDSWTPIAEWEIGNWELKVAENNIKPDDVKADLDQQLSSAAAAIGLGINRNLVAQIAVAPDPSATVEEPRSYLRPPSSLRAFFQEELPRSEKRGLAIGKSLGQDLYADVELDRRLKELRAKKDNLGL